MLASGLCALQVAHTAHPEREHEVSQSVRRRPTPASQRTSGPFLFPMKLLGTLASPSNRRLQVDHSLHTIMAMRWVLVDSRHCPPAFSGSQGPILSPSRGRTSNGPGLCVLHGHPTPSSWRHLEQFRHPGGNTQQKGTQTQSPSERESHKAGLVGNTGKAPVLTRQRGDLCEKY